MGPENGALPIGRLYRRYLSAALILWAIFLLVVLGLERLNYRNYALEHARVEARSVFLKDLLFRRWVSDQGGVYVPVTEKLSPNPYLTVENRDIPGPDGLTLTLVNPAYMTRLIHELSQEQTGVTGHMTSLDPIRPGNAPDSWERRALLSFQAGGTQFSEVVETNGHDFFRYMEPFYTEASCLKCHGAQGYTVGDVRGGLSVSVPLAPFFAEARRSYHFSVAAFLFVWLLGTAGILWVSRKIYGGFAAQVEAERLLQEANFRLSKAVDQRKEKIRRLSGRYEKKKKDLSSLVGELAEVQAQLVDSEKAAALRLLVGGMAHELNTPLGAIASSAGSVGALSERILANIASRAEPLDEDAGEDIRAFLDRYRREFVPSAVGVGEGRNAERVRSLAVEYGMDDPSDVAETLSDLAVPFDAEPYLPALRRGADFSLFRDLASVAQCVSVIESAAGQASREIEALKMYAADQEDGPDADFRVGDLLKEALSPFRPRLKEVRVVLSVDDGIRVRCDPARLRRAFYNLLENALQAMNFKGVLRLTVLRSGGAGLVAIEDDGPPIPEGLQSSLFKPFVTTKEDDAGKGLGLYLTKKVVDGYGGSVGFVSTAERTVFTVTLPAMEEERGA